MGVTGGDVPEHDHIVDTGKSSFGLDELGHIPVSYTHLTLPTIYSV